MKMIDIFGDLNPRFYFQNLYFYEINSHCPILDRNGKITPGIGKFTPFAEVKFLI